MWQCHYCRTPLSLEVQKRNRLCPNCGSDLHCCLNCHHFDASSGKCQEPNGQWVSDRASQNTCEFFEHSTARPTEASAATDSTTEAERAKAAFRALFRTV